MKKTELRKTVHVGNQKTGNQSIQYDTNELNNGLYLIKMINTSVSGVRDIQTVHKIQLNFVPNLIVIPVGKVTEVVEGKLLH